MRWKDLLTGLLKCWVALGRTAQGQSLHAWEGEVEVAGTGLFSRSGGWAGTKENGGGEQGAQEHRQSCRYPFLGLTQRERGGGRHVGSQDPANPKGGRASSSPIGWHS